MSFIRTLSLVVILTVVACNKVEEQASPVQPPAWKNRNATELKEECLQKVEELVKVADRVAEVKPEEATFANTAKELRQASAPIENTIQELTFHGYFAVDGSASEAGSKCESETSRAKIAIYSRPDVYRVLRAAADKRENLTGENAFLMKATLEEFERRGAALPERTRELLNEKQGLLVQLIEDYNRVMGEQGGKAAEVVDKEDLEGLDPRLIKTLEEKGKDPATGRIKVPVRPNYLAISTNVKDGEVRERFAKAMLRIGGTENEATLEKMTGVRHEIALLMGERDFRTFVLKRNLAKEPVKVLEFLNETSRRLAPKNQQVLNALLELKREEEPGAEKVLYHDLDYLRNLQKKKALGFDPVALSEYFPVGTVQKGMFEIYEEILGIKIEEVEGQEAWHPSVKLYRVLQNGQTKGFFYTDLYYRVGKIAHPGVAFDIHTGYQKPDGSRTLPVAALSMTINAGQSEKPALMTHAQVRTLFHEFGHIMHQVFMTNDYRHFGTDNTYANALAKVDFAEAPSQMLEHWIWEPEVLNRLSGKWDTAEKLPLEKIQKLTEARNIDQDANTWLRQVALSLIDLNYHAKALQPGESTKIFQEEYKSMTGVPIPEGTFPQASWVHMTIYEATYYGYLWARSLGEDMYTRFQRDGLFSPKVGADYANFILTPGPTQDPNEMVTRFLGRAPNRDAFFKYLVGN